MSLHRAALPCVARGATPCCSTVLVAVQHKKADFSSRVPNLGICSVDLPQAAYGTLTPPVDAQLFHDTSKDSLCTGGYYIDFVRDGQEGVLVGPLCVCATLTLYV